MFKTVLKLSIAAFLFCFLPLNAAHSHSKTTELQTINCSPDLQSCLLKILKIPESRALIAQVQKEGLFSIVSNNNSLATQFGAYWDLDYRTICINISSHRSEGEIIGSILFELHNAAATSQFNQIDRLAMSGKIDKKEYVKAVEYLEYQNSLKTARIAKIGIQRGIFSKDACLPTYNTFEEHFHIQKMAGHSAWIAKTYDSLVRCG